MLNNQFGALVVILAFLAAFGVAWWVISNPSVVNQSTVAPSFNLFDDSSLTINQTYKINRVVVMSGCIFDVYLENGKRYLVKLNGILDTPVEAKAKVIQRLNELDELNRGLFLIPRNWDSVEQKWLVDIFSGEDSTDTLTDWLVSNNLVFVR